MRLVIQISMKTGVGFRECGTFTETDIIFDRSDEVRQTTSNAMAREVFIKSLTTNPTKRERLRAVVPGSVPPDFDAPAALKEAREMGPFQFYNTVRNKGRWDHKQRGSDYEAFGNFWFGLSGQSTWWANPQLLLRGAGWAQTRAKTTRDTFGHWYDISSSFGDDPRDQEEIKRGIEALDILDDNTSEDNMGDPGGDRSDEPHEKLDPPEDMSLPLPRKN